MWILRKPRFWFSGRKECQQFTSQSGYVEMLYTKWTNISIWDSSSTPRAPGRTMWTTSVARQREELASSTASENDYPLWLYDQYTWHPWDLRYSNMPNWPGADVGQDISHLERLQRRAARVITGVKPWSSTGTCHEVLLAHAGLPTLSERRLIAQAVFVFKVVNELDIPCHLSNLIQAWLPEKPSRCLALRDSRTIRQPGFK